MRRALHAATAVLVLAATVVAAPASGAGAPPAGPAQIDAPEAVDAGTGFDVEVSVPPGVDAVDLSLLDAFATTTLRRDVTGGSATFNIRPAETTVAGLMTLVATGEGLIQSTVDVTVRAAAAAEPIVALIGPRSVVADGEDFTMVSVLAGDRFGNPLPDGTPLQLERRLPDGGTRTQTITVDHHVARTRLVAGTRAGEDHVSVSAGDVRGPERPFTEVAGLPIAFGLERDATDPLRPEADGRTLVRVRTETLIDRYANLVPDGTVVEFRLTGPDGPATFQGVTVDGQATVVLQAPARPGPVRVQAWVSDRASDVVTIEFGAAVGALPGRARVVDGVVTVRVGPVLGRRGAYVADGTVVYFLARQAAAGDAASASPVVAEGRIVLVDGRGHARLGSIDPDRPWRVELSSSGATTTVSGP